MKQFLNLNEQLEILKSRGLIIEDEDKAKLILFRENYFFISGYRHVFFRSPKDRVYVQGTTFNELYSLFSFDRNFRNIMFKYLLIVENNIKSILSYQLSKKYGYKEKDYMKPSNFTQDAKKVRQVNDLIKKMKRQIRVNGRQHSATYHYISNYGYIPLWILVKVLSFGLIGELYSILKVEDQLAIADVYDIDVDVLSTYLSILANYRNLCAHEDILFERRVDKNIVDTKYHRMLNIPIMDDEYIYGKNDLYAVVIMLKHLLSEDEFRMLINEIGYEVDRLNGVIKSIPFEKILDRMGFPNNWRDIVNM